MLDAKLALTKTNTTDDASPSASAAVHVSLPQYYDTQGDKPTGSASVFARLLDGSGNDVPGASCTVRLWARVSLGGGVSTWIDCGRRQYVSGRTLATWGFGAVNGPLDLYCQITDVLGAPSKIELYAIAGGDLPGAFDPVTGALRVADVLQRGGEQNAIGAHMVALRGTQSADGAVAWKDSAALESSGVIKAGPGNLYGFVMSSAGATAVAGWLHFYDSITVPADGTVPKMIFALAAFPATRAEDIPGERRYFATGMAWAISSTPATKTLVTATALTQHFGQIAYS